MCDKLKMAKKRLQEIRCMDTDELVKATKNLELSEKKTLALLIAHISEVSARKAHLDIGYPNLFEYVTRELNVSSGAASMRIQVANVCQKFPEILVALAEDRLNFTAAAKLSPILTEENSHELIERAKGLSTRDLEELLVNLKFKEEPEHKPTIRKAREISGDNKAERKEDEKRCPISDNVGDAQGTGSLLSSQLFPSNPVETKTQSGQKANLTPARPDRYNIKFSIDKTLKNKLERLGEVLGIRAIELNLERIIDRAIEDSLEKRDPIRKEERAEKRRDTQKKEKTRTPSSKPISDLVGPSGEGEQGGSSHPANGERSNMKSAESVSKEQKEASRSPEISTTHIPEAAKKMAISSDISFITAKNRAMTLKSANYQCEYVSPEGLRCTARENLHIDHIIPKAWGGNGSPDNLQALCSCHNLRKAEIEMGENFIRSKVMESRLTF